MKRIVIIVLLSIILFILVSRRISGMAAQDAVKQASSLKVTLFEDCDFKGKSVEVPIGEYASMDKAGFGNDVLSSMKIPEGLQVVIFIHDNFRGQRAILYTDIGCLKSVGIQTMGDKTSSLKVSLKEAPTTAVGRAGPTASVAVAATKVTLFAECDFKGKMVDVSIGDYATMDAAGFGNDMLSSIKIPAGLRVKIFEHDNFQGYFYLLDRDVGCLDINKKIGAASWNDRTSSIKIYKA
jgi:hypothetical protein